MLGVDKPQLDEITSVSPKIVVAEERLAAESSHPRECPFCCEPIKAAAVKCPHCGESIGRHLYSTQKYSTWSIYRLERFLETVTLRVKNAAFFEILDYVSRLSVLIAVLFWFADSGERTRQNQLQAWQIVSLGSQIGGGIGTVQALESLNCTDASWFCKSVSLEGVKLEKVNLPKLDLHSAVLIDAELIDANLSSADLSRAKLSDAYLINADLSRAKLIRADLSGAKLSGANLIDAELIDADLSGASLANSDLSGAKLSRANLSGAYLQGAYLRGADLQGAYLRAADLSRAYLRGADLRAADLSGANLRDAKLSGFLYNILTIWPKGFYPP